MPLSTTVSAVDVWSLPSRNLSNLFPHILAYDIRLDGGETQVLAAGLWIVSCQTDAYGNDSWINNKLHIEIYNGAAWKDWLIATSNYLPVTILSDGINVRVANGAGAGTWCRLVGCRTW